MRKLLALGSIGFLGLVAAPALAHHSAAMFDESKTITLGGTVKEWQYTNPHSWLELVVTDPSGKLVQWSLESESPALLIRRGIKYNSMQPGEKVTVTAHPMRDGRPGGSMLTVTKEDGTLVGRPMPAAGGGQAKPTT